MRPIMQAPDIVQDLHGMNLGPATVCGPRA